MSTTLSCLSFGRARAPRVFETSPMLLPATVDIAERKEDIAPQMMQPGKLIHHIIALGRLLGALEQFEYLT